MAYLITPNIIVDDVPRGKGIEGDPIRRVEQWWSPNGTLLLEYDPVLDAATMAINMVHFLRNSKPTEDEK